MSRLSAKLRKIEGGYGHWCPGCNELHAIAVETPQRNGARWTFDGNAETPTFTPSVNISWGWPDQPQGQERCHYFVTKGNLLFCSDSTHQLAGQTVPLPDLPDHLKD